jgi:GH25 family lysozyme M1 (1,4-beta-N-acetylmuramidase)
MRPAPATRVLACLAAACALLLAAAPAQAGKGKALGIDVSRFQGTIDWTQVKGAGVRFAFVQASRGNGLDCDVVPDECGADAYYATNYAAARALKIRVGAYHRAFIDPAPDALLRADARAEADIFLAGVGSLRKGDLLPALDAETPFDGATPAQLQTWISTWLKRVRKRLGVRPIIYTNTTSWTAVGNTSKFARAGHHLWVANWGVSKPSVPAGNWARRGWSIWQFTSSGKIPGISGRVDLNRLRVRFSKIGVR